MIPKCNPVLLLYPSSTFNSLIQARCNKYACSLNLLKLINWAFILNVLVNDLAVNQTIISLMNDWRMVCSCFCLDIEDAEIKNRICRNSKVSISAAAELTTLSLFTQKFRFCGDGDCPEWVLAEIHSTLSMLTSVKLRILTQLVVQSILGDEIPVG